MLAGSLRYIDTPNGALTLKRTAPLKEVRKHGFVLTPGRYVGAEAQEDDGEAFEAKMRRFVAQLREQTVQARMLDDAIARNLEDLGFGGNACGNE